MRRGPAPGSTSSTVPTAMLVRAVAVSPASRTAPATRPPRTGLDWAGSNTGPAATAAALPENLETQSRSTPVTWARTCPGKLVGGMQVNKRSLVCHNVDQKIKL